MKKIKVLFQICIIIFVNNIVAQKFIDQVSVGDYFPENYKIGGYKTHKIDKEYSELGCKAFVIDYTESIASNSSSLIDFERNGGTLSKRLYFYIDNKGLVVGKKVLQIVMYAGSNGLRMFLNHKKRISDYISNYPVKWNLLDEHEFSNLERYFAYTVEGYTQTNEQVVKVISIQENKYFEETYLPKSIYSPLYIVGDPNEKFEEKSTTDILLSEDFLDEFCRDNYDNDEICKCFKKEALVFLEVNKNTIKEHEIMGEMARILYQCAN